MYALLMFVLSALLPFAKGFDNALAVLEIFIGFLLAAWTARKIRNNNSTPP
jgi:hypothetical protein